MGETIEVCLEFDLPPTRGIRRIVGVFANERGEVVELTDVPARMSECVLQEPSQTALQGRASHPGVYEMLRDAPAQGEAPAGRDVREPAGDRLRGKGHRARGRKVAPGMRTIRLSP